VRPPTRRFSLRWIPKNRHPAPEVVGMMVKSRMPEKRDWSIQHGQKVGAITSQWLLLIMNYVGYTELDRLFWTFLSPTANYVITLKDSANSSSD